MKLYSVGEVAKLFGWKGRKVNRLIHNKCIRAIRSPSVSGKNGRYFIRHDDLLKLAEKVKYPEVVAQLKAKVKP